MIGQRLDAAMHEHASGLDPAPPRERFEVVLRLDDFMLVEQLADAFDCDGVIPNVLVGDDDLVATADVDGGADGIDASVEVSMPWPRGDMARHPTKDSAVALENRR